MFARLPSISTEKEILLPRSDGGGEVLTRKLSGAVHTYARIPTQFRMLKRVKKFLRLGETVFTEYDWQFETTPQNALNGRKIAYNRRKYINTIFVNTSMTSQTSVFWRIDDATRL